MSAVTFEVVGAEAERYAFVPTLNLRLRITETTGTPVHALALRGQIMIEPQRRRYGHGEEERLVELFGEAPRWGDTLKPFLWTHIGIMVPGFTDEIELDVAVTCTYDTEIAASKYFTGLEDGEIPILLLFSGTVFAKSPGDQAALPAFAAAPVAWHEEARYRVPVATWREVMDLYFPNSGWVRVGRETLDALQRFKAARGLHTWEHAFERLLKEAGEEGL